MPRYNVTFSASNGQARTVTISGWSLNDCDAIAWARLKLAAMRNVRRGLRDLDTWEVWTGTPPYSPHKTVAAGGIRSHPHPDQPA